MDQYESVLVMGGLGFVGSHLCRNFNSNGYRVRIFDKLYTSKELISDFRNKVEIIESDIQKSDDIAAALEGIDVVIDLIHTTVPGSSMQNPAYDISSNVTSHVNWLKQLSVQNIKKLIYVSSGGTIYGVPQRLPIDEGHPTNPISSYGITKLCIEKYVAMYTGLYGIDYAICRPANVYGGGQHLNIGQGVIGMFLDCAIGGRPIEIWGDGTSKRDYLHVEDLIRAIEKLISYEGDEHVFNVGTSTGYTLLDIVQHIEQVISIELVVNFKPDRGFDVPENVLDHGLLSRETSWKPQVTLHQGIQWLWQCYLEKAKQLSEKSVAT